MKMGTILLLRRDALMPAPVTRSDRKNCDGLRFCAALHGRKYVARPSRHLSMADVWGPTGRPTEPRRRHRSCLPSVAFRPEPRLKPRDDRRPNRSEAPAPDEHREMLQAHAHLPGIPDDARVLGRHLINEGRHRGRRSNLVGGVDDREDWNGDARGSDGSITHRYSSLTKTVFA